MAKSVKQPEVKFIAVDDCGTVLCRESSLDSMIQELRSWMKDTYNYEADDPLSDYIKDEGIVVYEVVTALKIEEKVVRTILINGEPASL